MRRCLRDLTFSRFDTIPECDRHTTTANTALSIASRGKNWLLGPIRFFVDHSNSIILYLVYILLSFQTRIYLFSGMQHAHMEYEVECSRPKG